MSGGITVNGDVSITRKHEEEMEKKNDRLRRKIKPAGIRKEYHPPPGIVKIDLRDGGGDSRIPALTGIAGEREEDDVPYGRNWQKEMFER